MLPGAIDVVFQHSRHSRVYCLDEEVDGVAVLREGSATESGACRVPLCSGSAMMLVPVRCNASAVVELSCIPLVLL